MKECVAFDDVLLVPPHSSVKSRNDPDTTTTIGSLIIDVPLISSPMDTVTESAMAIALGRLGGMGIIHRFMSKEEQAEQLEVLLYTADPRVRLVPAVGVTSEEMDRFDYLWDKFGYSLSMVSVDIANGHHTLMEDMILHIQKTAPGLSIMAGNVATGEGYRCLAQDFGVDAIRCGIGGGCFTASTKVLMSDGSYRNINKIKVGEHVINGDGDSVRVKSVINSGYKKVSRIRSSSWAEDIYVTPEHRYWSADFRGIKNLNKVSKSKSIDRKRKDGTSRVGWNAISNCASDPSVILLPRRINFDLKDNFEESLSEYTIRKSHLDDIKISSNYNVGYAFGLMMGDGHAFLNNNGKSEIGRISCYLGENEMDIAIKLKSILEEEFNSKSDIINSENMIEVRSYSKPLAHLFHQFGKGSFKHLPEKYRVKNLDYLNGLFEGLVDSDGHIEKSGRTSFYNTSEKLKELFEFILISLGKTFSSTIREPRASNLIGCDIDNCNPCYQVRLHTSNRKSKDYVYSNILSYEETALEQETWDIEVDCITHSFIANNSIVHNSICKTRIQTGFGVPTLQSIIDAYEAKMKYGLSASIIADGGIKYPADLVKSIVAGADAIMAGSLFAGTKEAPGGLIYTNDGKAWKNYRGMASAEVQQDKKGGVKPGTVAEGVSHLTEYKGSLERVVNEFVGGLRSGMAYGNALCLSDLRNVEMVRITSSGVSESHAHGTRVR